MTENEFITAVGVRLKITPFYQTQRVQTADDSRAPRSTRFLVPFSRR